MAYSSVRPLSALLSFLSEQCLSQRPLERVCHFLCSKLSLRVGPSGRLPVTLPSVLRQDAITPCGVINSPHFLLQCRLFLFLLLFQNVRLILDGYLCAGQRQLQPAFRQLSFFRLTADARL